MDALRVPPPRPPFLLRRVVLSLSSLSACIYLSVCVFSVYLLRQKRSILLKHDTLTLHLCTFFTLLQTCDDIYFFNEKMHVFFTICRSMLLYTRAQLATAWSTMYCLWPPHVQLFVATPPLHIGSRRVLFVATTIRVSDNSVNVYILLL